MIFSNFFFKERNAFIGWLNSVGYKNNVTILFSSNDGVTRVTFNVSRHKCRILFVVYHQLVADGKKQVYSPITLATVENENKQLDILFNLGELRVFVSHNEN